MSELSRIKTRLFVLRGRIATALALDGSARLAAALLAAVAVSFGLDRLFRLEVAARAVLLAAGLALFMLTLVVSLVARRIVERSAAVK